MNAPSLHIVSASALLFGAAHAGAQPVAATFWNFANQFRLSLTIDARGRRRSNTPVAVEVDFQELLAAQNVRGSFDKHTVEVIPVNGRERPERVPDRIDELFGGSSTTLHFAMPDERHTNYVVCFDTLESGRGKPRRYHGLVGDGDRDQDFFPSFGDGPDSGQIIFYRNTTQDHGGQLTFTRVGPLQFTTGVPLAGGAEAEGWFPSIVFALDWDGEV